MANASDVFRTLFFYSSISGPSARHGAFNSKLIGNSKFGYGSQCLSSHHPVKQMHELCLLLSFVHDFLLSFWYQSTRSSCDSMLAASPTGAEKWRFLWGREAHGILGRFHSGRLGKNTHFFFFWLLFRTDNNNGKECIIGVSPTLALTMSCFYGSMRKWECQQHLFLLRLQMLLESGTQYGTVTCRWQLQD